MSDGVGDDVSTAAWHYDGCSATRHRVNVTLSGGMLHIPETGESVPIARLRAAGDHGIESFGLLGRPGWRIDPIDPFPPHLRALLPRQEKYGRIMDRLGVPVTIVAGAVLAVVALYLFTIGTGAAARAFPLRWEIALGESLSGKMEGSACRNPAGQAALGRLSAELQARGDLPIRIATVNLPIANAVTLPGRQIILFRGLLDQAASPDEVAGVLAHEMGHVAHRDAMVSLLRGYGLSLLIGGVDGGALMQTLVVNRYSRGTERDADAYAIAALRRTRISGQGAANFFDRLSKFEPAAAGINTAATLLSTHPLSAERRMAFAAAKSAADRPALSPDQWAALKAICRAK